MNPQSKRDESALLWILAVATSVVIASGVGCMLAACKPGIDVKKAAVDVVQHQAVLDKCKVEARDAGKYEAFEACLGDAGVK